MTTDIVLPPSCYEALESSIRKHGIGAGRYHTFAPRRNNAGVDAIPCCFVGHCDDCFGWQPGRDLRDALGIGEGRSDRAVRSINARKGTKTDARVTWDEFRDEMRLLKGVLPHDFGESCDLSAHDSSIPCNVRTPFDVSRLVEQSPQRV